MADKTIIADAGPLIAFGRTKRLSVLKETLGEIIAPHQVLKECLANLTLPGAKEIAQAIEQDVITPHADLESSEHRHLLDTLGHGETAAIILAAQLKTGLLIDEKLGRQVAQKMNLHIIGTAGVLLLSKERKITDKVTPVLRELKNAGYYLSQELIETVLKKANEKLN